MMTEFERICGSIGIQREAVKRGEEPELAGRFDAGVLWQFSDGTQVLETNGDPVWEDDEGFADLVK